MIKTCCLPGIHFEDYNLCLNWHIQSLGVKTEQDLDGTNFFVFVAGFIPTQKE